MTHSSAIRLAPALRSLRALRIPSRPALQRSACLQGSSPRLRPAQCNPSLNCFRAFHTVLPRRISILGSADKPEQAKEPHQGLQTSQAAPLTDDEYHQRSDAFFEELLAKLEEKQETSGDMDVEYAQGVMNVTVPSKGTYVLNKQPPNRQIWLSSPESGPKRFDWVITGESMHHKEGGETAGDWVYLRDGTSLAELLRVEVGVTLESAGREL